MAFFSAGFCSGKGMLTPPHVAHRHTHTYSVCEQHGQTVIVSNKWCHYLKTQQLEYYYHISGSQLGFLPIVSHSPTHWWERKDRVRVLFWIFFFFSYLWHVFISLMPCQGVKVMQLPLWYFNHPLKQHYEYQSMLLQKALPREDPPVMLMFFCFVFF